MGWLGDFFAGKRKPEWYSGQLKSLSEQRQNFETELAQIKKRLGLSGYKADWDIHELEYELRFEHGGRIGGPRANISKEEDKLLTRVFTIKQELRRIDREVADLTADIKKYGYAA